METDHFRTYINRIPNESPETIYTFFFLERALASFADPIINKIGINHKDKKKHTVNKGTITVHQYEDKIYLELPVELMGRDFLVNSAITTASDISESTKDVLL